MVKISKDYHFEAAHRLINYVGPCSNIHGHSYKVRVTFTSGCLDKQDMVLDFKAIRLIIGNWIDANLDHALILSCKDTAIAEAILKSQSGVKLYFTTWSPTAEVLAEVIFQEAQSNSIKFGVTLLAVQVWETTSAYAEVTND